MEVVKAIVKGRAGRSAHVVVYDAGGEASVTYMWEGREVTLDSWVYVVPFKERARMQALDAAEWCVGAILSGKDPLREWASVLSGVSASHQ